MGGDHKCPVCQATFTRPQHVARHMRSHTGDRPYKCQHCGDQFARSDLLSRHVNKCHSAEKDLGHPPLPGVAPGRRKGSSAATRATTSKQACDQCVQGSLPCDGSNPCAKCVARKVRCTFVKFHRQTAPVGPGHAASLVASHPSSTSSGAVLEPNPSSSSASGLPLPTLLPGLALTQPHLSANSPHPLHLAHPGESAPFLYAQQAASGGGGYHHGEYDSRSSYEQQQRRRDSDPYYPPPPGSAGSGAYYGGYRESFDGRDFDGRSIDSSDFDGRSDRGSSVGGGSRPQSSAGLPGGEYAPYLPNGRHHATASLDLHHHQQRGGEFSSAFGLMSLDDPNVLAGLATDGVPFFSHGVAPQHPQQGLPPQPPGGRPHSSHHPHAKLLPAPPALQYEPPSHSYSGGAALPTPGPSREAETRELREFWKAYMRTPLTGPGELGMQTPSANATGQLGVASPSSGGRRLVRVASLPSVKTPESEFVPSYGQGAVPPQRAGTMHNADDLRSYEAAVLARKAPELTLRKPVRKAGTSSKQAGSSSSSQQQRQHAPPPSQQAFEFGREHSASSLAGAFGPTGGSYGASTGSPHSPFPGTPSSSGGASASASDGEDTSGSNNGGGRPSFKRLPSQTLGPAQSKRRPPPNLSMGMPTPLGGGVGYAAPGVGAGVAVERPPSVHAYPERPMIALRHPPGHGHRGRRLSEPASPTAPGFVHV